MELYAKSRYLHIVAWAKLYEKNLFNDISFPYGKVHEDMAVMYLLLQKVEKVVVTTNPVYFVSCRIGSITRSEYNRDRLDCWYTHYNKALEYHKEHNARIYPAVQAGYLKDVISYWNLAMEANDKEIANILRRKFKECINIKAFYLLGKRNKLRVLLFLLMPRIKIYKLL